MKTLEGSLLTIPKLNSSKTVDFSNLSSSKSGQKLPYLNSKLSDSNLKSSSKGDLVPLTNPEYQE